MKTLKLIRFGAALALCLFAFSLASAQGDFSKVEMKTTKINGNVYMLEGSGGNIGVSAGPDGLLMVDDQFKPLADKIRVALKAINPGQLRFILNTHWHYDHTGGNEVFGPEALIIAQDNVRKRLLTGGDIGGNKIDATPASGWPIITFSQSLSIHFNGEEIRVIHFPKGHTDGDSIIFFTGANVVHLGDHFFAGRFPFVDLDSGGSVEGLIRNVGDVIAQLPADVKIIPGHGPLSNLDDLKTYHQTLTETVEIVRAQMKAGKTLAQIKAAGLPDKYKVWGSGFMNTAGWLETVYKSLSADAKKAMPKRVKPPTE